MTGTNNLENKFQCHWNHLRIILCSFVVVELFVIYVKMIGNEFK